MVFCGFFEGNWTIGWWKETAGRQDNTKSICLKSTRSQAQLVLCQEWCMMAMCMQGLLIMWCELSARVDQPLDFASWSANTLSLLPEPPRVLYIYIPAWFCICRSTSKGIINVEEYESATELRRPPPRPLPRPPPPPPPPAPYLLCDHEDTERESPNVMVCGLVYGLELDENSAQGRQLA